MSNKYPRCPSCGKYLKLSHLEMDKWVCKGQDGCNSIFNDNDLERHQKKNSIYNFGGK